MSTGRMPITVTKVEEVREVGDKHAKLLEFKGTVSDGSEITFETFKTNIFERIKVGAKLDAEVETTERGQYIHRRVNQLFENGQAVGGQRGGGGNWQPRPDNSASIESQAAAKIAGELVIADKCPENVKDALFAWLKARLVTEQPKQADKPAESKPATSDKAKPRHFKDAEDFKTAALAELQLTAAAISKEYPEVAQTIKAGNLDKAWIQLVEACSLKRNLFD